MLIRGRGEFRKNKKPVFFNIESLETHFFIIFEKLCNAGLNLRYFRQFLLLIFKNPLKILEIFFKSEKFFSKVVNKKSNSST